MKQKTICYKDGSVFTGDYFEESDFLFFKEIFIDWLKINEKLKSLGGRTLNVPDVISEAIFCYFFNAIRTNNTGYSFDCILLDDFSGVQIKSSSIEYDLTSFGPRTHWDKLYFVDMAPNGIVDGNLYFYEIIQDVDNIILNKTKGETFKMQQLQGRRPRFSIKKEIINKFKLSPVLKVDLLS